MIDLLKYPRTPHLPWSEGVGSDDRVLSTIKHFVGELVVITEKMDGECTTITKDRCYARSLDSGRHESRDWVKSLWASKRHELDGNYRIHGENLFAKHSIQYHDLKSYFMLFGVSDSNSFLSWPDTEELAELLGLDMVPTIFSGVFYEDMIPSLHKMCFDPVKSDGNKQEGYVIRLSRRFPITEFGRSVAKFVRANHVETEKHWIRSSVERNSLRVN